MMTQGSWRSDLLLVLVTLLAGLGWVFSREALLGMAPLFFIGVRFLCASLILAVPGWTGLRHLAAESWRRALLTGVVMGLAMCLWIMGLQHTENMGIGAFLTSLGVVLIPIVGKVLFGAPTARSTWVAVVIALAGLACLRLEGGFSLSLSDLYFLGAAVVFSLHFNLNSRYAARLPALPLTAIQLGVTGLLALALSLLLEPTPEVPGSAVIGWLLASIVIGTCMRFFIQVKAQGMAPVSHAAVIMTLEPVWTSLLGVFWFAETMTVIQLFGCCLIFGALLVSRWRLLLRRPAIP
ncbi:DMT family transporter [Nitrincola sp. MINF-07-Sa-05]|uniref:DMT family transporter n=1 Tax=Nitrincola salilacus TaxID=3400273 RepID=UPI0039180DBB